MSQSIARKLRRIKIANERPKGTTLDKFNDNQVGRYLHPTRGWKKVNVKRSIAGEITGMMLRGFGGTTAEIREALSNV